MLDGHSNSEHRHKSLESGVMRKYHAPFGGRPTEKGSIQSTSPAAHPTQFPVGPIMNPSARATRRARPIVRSNCKDVAMTYAHGHDAPPQIRTGDNESS